jgi:hypothetical protein
MNAFGAFLVLTVILGGMAWVYAYLAMITWRRVRAIRWDLQFAREIVTFLKGFHNTFRKGFSNMKAFGKRKGKRIAACGLFLLAFYLSQPVQTYGSGLLYELTGRGRKAEPTTALIVAMVGLLFWFDKKEAS